MKLGIRSAGLSKTYGKTRAVSNLNLEIETGSIYGLIGPNGAGKTTTLALLAGLIKPTAGVAWILGNQVQPGCRSPAARVGFSSPQFPLLDYLTGFEMLSACGLMHGLPAKEVKKRTLDLLELLDLQAASGEYISHYSQGMRQKVGLACAIIHVPHVLLLDEPFLGLDLASVYGMAGILDQMTGKGHTIVVSSHNMDLVERVCKKVGILHRGVVEKEMVISAKGTCMEASRIGPDSCSALEAALWEVVGAPQPKELTWI